MDRSMIQSLYLVRSDEKIAFEKEEFEIYFAMIRLDFKDSPLASAILTDAFYYFYMEQLPLIDNELELIYTLRSALMKKTRTTKKFERIKRNTIASYTKSFLAAAMVTNLFLDLIQMQESKCTEEEYALILKYAGISNALFPRNISDFNDLPRQLILVETKMMRYMEEAYNAEETFIDESITEIIRFIDTLTINEKMLYAQI